MWIASTDERTYQEKAVNNKMVLSDFHRRQGFYLPVPETDEPIYPKVTSDGSENEALIDDIKRNYTALIADGLYADDCVATTLSGLLVEIPELEVFLISNGTNINSRTTEDDVRKALEISYKAFIADTKIDQKRFHIITSDQMEETIAPIPQ